MFPNQQPVDFSQQVLRTDVAGMPLEWIDYQDAVRLYHTEQVAYTCGTPIYSVRGGINAASGLRSIVEVNSIIATVGRTPGGVERRNQYIPPLNNKTLFRRDASLCLYCGGHFMSRDLTRDHVQPLAHLVFEEPRRVLRIERGTTFPGSSLQLGQPWINHFLAFIDGLLADLPATHVVPAAAEFWSGAPLESILIGKPEELEQRLSWLEILLGLPSKPPPAPANED